MHPALFYRPGERLTLPELCAARLDGVLIEVGDGYMPIDTVEEAHSRATSIAHLVPASMAVSGPSAAWVHGAGDAAPNLLHLRRTLPTRLRAHPQARVIYHERRAQPEDVQVLAGLQVTTPMATAWELLFAAGQEGMHEVWLHELLHLQPELVRRLGALLERTPRRPGRRQAVRRLALHLPAASGGSDPVDVVDGVDSSHGVEHPVQVHRVAHLENEAAER